jgi:hypothetical protein
VEIEAQGPAVDMAYCHYDQCRRYSGAPLAEFTIPKAKNVKVAKGSELLPIKDGLPKLRDFPAAIGGSGEAMPE